MTITEKQRSNFAVKTRKNRAFYGREYFKFYREIKASQQIPCKPTAVSLWTEALGYLRYPQQLTRQQGNEYYSMCGAEDGEWERKREYRILAQELYDEAKRLNPHCVTIPELDP